MKLNASLLVVAAITLGSLGVGCGKSIVSDDPVAPEETAAEAPVVDANGNPEPGPGFEVNSLRYRYHHRYYAPHAPPRARYERQGHAPSHRHFWAPGYHRWNGRQHVWFGGRWELNRSGYLYMNPRWEQRQSRWQYVPGHWTRR